MLEKVAEMIKEQLNTGDVVITEATRFHEDLDADSLDLFELVMALEEEFNIEIDTAELEQIKTVGAIIDYMKSKGVEE